MLTEKDYCNNEICVALEKLGFSIRKIKVKGEEKRIPILLYEAQKWLREEQKLHITIFSQSQESWQYRITKPYQRLEDGLYGEDYSSFEEALLEGIKEAVKISKEKKMKLFEIWTEGYIVPECHARAWMIGMQEAETFEQACDLFVENHPKYKDCYRKDKDGNPIYWGCRLFDNEIDARKAFG